MRFVIATAVCFVLPNAGFPAGLLDKVKEGAASVGGVVTDTAGAVGDAANVVGEAVGESLDSTAEMVTNEETPELTRQRMDSVAAESLNLLFAENAEAKALFDQGYGYAVFDARQLSLVGATAGYGRGVAVEKSSGEKTYMRMGTGGVGLSFGIGGFSRKVIGLFENEAIFRDFVDNGYDATAQAGGKFGEDEEKQEVRFVDGRSIFILTKKGWLVSASAAGTKYWKDAELNR